MINIFRKIKSLFLKDEYYVLDDNILNSIERFNEPNKRLLESFLFSLRNLEEVAKIDDKKNSLHENEATRFQDEEELLVKVKQTLESDYRSNKIEAAEKGWNFSYLMLRTKLIEDALVVAVELEYPKNENLGEVIYNVLAVKRKASKFYLWDMR